MITTNLTGNLGNHMWQYAVCRAVAEKLGYEWGINPSQSQEYNTSYFKNNVKNNIIGNMDPFFRGHLTQVEIDSTFPKYILENIDKYSNMIKPK